MHVFHDFTAEFADLDTQACGIRVDSLSAQNVWMQEHDLNVSMISGRNPDLW